jgi:hypothetical protein
MPTAHRALRPQDIVVVLAVHHLATARWTYAALAERLGLPDSHAHAAVQRAIRSHLNEEDSRRVRTRNLLEFLEHGVRYAFPVEPGPVARGVPTGASAPPLDTLMQDNSAGDLVWAHVDGKTTGQSLTPLHPNVPTIAMEIPPLHECLALVDALRIGGVRERQLAARELHGRLDPRSG